MSLLQHYCKPWHRNKHFFVSLIYCCVHKIRPESRNYRGVIKSCLNRSALQWNLGYLPDCQLSWTWKKKGSCFAFLILVVWTLCESAHVKLIIQLLRLCGVQGDGIWAPRALEYCPKIDMNVPA